MSRRTTSLAIASLAAASFITLGSASASAKDHVDLGLEFLDHAVENEWGTEPDCFINWETPPEPSPDGAVVPGSDSGPWTSLTKAACFFTLTLQKSRGYTPRDIRSMWGKNSPTSDLYFDVINASPSLNSSPPGFETYFRRVTRAVDIQKGDVIAVGATETYSGHTMVVTGTPTEIYPQILPRYSGTKQYAVPIMDSTNSSHGCNAVYPDSRWTGTCTGGYGGSGIGTGYIRVYTDSMTGILLGYTWSVTASTTSYYSPSTRPYRVGRLFKLPAPLPTEDPPPPP